MLRKDILQKKIVGCLNIFYCLAEPLSRGAVLCGLQLLIKVVAEIVKFDN